MPKVKFSKVSMYKTDFNRFEIQFPYDRVIVQICRDIPGRRFMDNKRWSFPIQQYNILTNKLKKVPKIEIINELTKSELDEIQVVLLAEDEYSFQVSFPKNTELYKITKSFDGFWDEKKFCWSMNITKKEGFLKKLNSLNFQFKKFEKPECGTRNNF